MVDEFRWNVVNIQSRIGHREQSEGNGDQVGWCDDEGRWIVHRCHRHAHQTGGVEGPVTDTVGKEVRPIVVRQPPVADRTTVGVKAREHPVSGRRHHGVGHRTFHIRAQQEEVRCHILGRADAKALRHRPVIHRRDGDADRPGRKEAAVTHAVGKEVRPIVVRQPPVGDRTTVGVKAREHPVGGRRHHGVGHRTLHIRAQQEEVCCHLLGRDDCKRTRRGRRVGAQPRLENHIHPICL